MDIYAKYGAKVRYLNENGRPHDRERANALLKEGKVYTVDHTDPDYWHTDVYLIEVPGKPFNSVMFDDVDAPAEGEQQMAAPLDTERMWTKLQSEATAKTWNGLNWAECSALLQEVERLRAALELRQELITSVQQAGWGIHAYDSDNAMKRVAEILAIMDAALTTPKEGDKPNG